MDRLSGDLSPQRQQGYQGLAPLLALRAKESDKQWLDLTGSKRERVNE